MQRIIILSLVTIIYANQAHAQATKNVPNALQGFSQNRNQPVQIDANALEVREPEKMAIFSGDVNVIQGDTQMKAQRLKVFYEQNGTSETKTMPSATPGPGGSQQIKRLEAIGSVSVRQKDQLASGDMGIFDMKTNTVTLSGNVVLTQGQNILRGERLIVDLASGVSRVEASKSGIGRVQGLFLPSSAPSPAPSPKPAGQ